MAKRKTNGILNRLAGKKIVFNGRFDYGQRERLEALAEAHGATVLDNLDASVDILVVRDLASGKTVQARAQKLNAIGASIQVVEAEVFAKQVEVTQEEALALLRGGPNSAPAFALAVGDIRHLYSHSPNLAAIRLAGERLDGLDLTGFGFATVEFEQCSFKRAKLPRVPVGHAVRCDFSEADGAGAEFGDIQGTRFTGARLKEAQVYGDLAEADFTGAVLEGAQFWRGATHRAKPAARTNTLGAVFRRAVLRAASFRDISLRSPDFDQADLAASAFMGCSLEGAIFESANLEGSTFIGCNLAAADFRRADLRGANLADANLTGARFDGADLSNCNLRGAKLTGVDLSGAKNYDPNAGTAGAVGQALTELDSVGAKADRIEFTFRLRTGPDDEGEEVGVDTASLKYGWGLRLPPVLSGGFHRHQPATTISDAMLQLARLLPHRTVRYETVNVGSTKSPKSGKELRGLVIRAIAEAFAQPAPAEADLAAATRTYREQVREITSAQRQEREKAKEQALKQQEKAKKQIAKKIEKEVGKVTDTATFLKALELRIEPEKIKKATKMLKASKFQLYNDVTNTHTSGVVKSQTDPDLVYACRINDDGTYACCTQNLNICGGLRGSICKHLLVLIIGLVNANQLDPVTIDEWVAKSQNAKPKLDKEKMGDIFIKYKGAEAGEIDWRPTETLPEDYYSL